MRLATCYRLSCSVLLFQFQFSSKYRCFCLQTCDIVELCDTSAQPHCSNWVSHYPLLLCKTSSQQACVTKVAHVETCCSYRCAVKWPSTNALQHCSGQIVSPTVHCGSTKQAHVVGNHVLQRYLSAMLICAIKCWWHYIMAYVQALHCDVIHCKWSSICALPHDQVQVIKTDKQ